MIEFCTAIALIGIGFFAGLALGIVGMLADEPERTRSRAR